MCQLVGEKLTDTFFDFEEELNALRMTRKELALMISYIMSQPGFSLFRFKFINAVVFVFNEMILNELVILFLELIYENASMFRLLQDNYKRALFYEFDVNKRDDAFLQKWNRVCFCLFVCLFLRSILLFGCRNIYFNLVFSF